jgi:hypothetical protein
MVQTQVASNMAANALNINERLIILSSSKLLDSAHITFSAIYPYPLF